MDKKIKYNGYKFKLEVNSYEDNNRLAILLYNNSDLFEVLTVNLPEIPIKNINENFINNKIDGTVIHRDSFISKLKELGIIEIVHPPVPYNMNTYSLAKFNLEKLREYDHKGVDKYYKLLKEKNILYNKTNIEPFQIFKYDTDDIPINLGKDYYYSIILDQNHFNYNWVSEEKATPSIYGDGHCYDALFHDYIEDNYLGLNRFLNYDSENGMFCVYCKTEKIANLIGDILSSLYNNEEKMIELIRKTKEKYNIEFDVNFNI